MTLSSERPEFKTCTNCGGDGYEDSGPLRKCWTCRGRGFVAVPREKRPGIGVERNPNEACNAVQGA